VNHLEATKTVVGSTVTSAAGTATLTLDTLGYDYASVDVVVAVGAVEAATSPILKALSLYQYDNTATTAAVYTVTAPAANDAVTNQPSVVRFDVDRTRPPRPRCRPRSWLGSARARRAPSRLPTRACLRSTAADRLTASTQ